MKCKNPNKSGDLIWCGSDDPQLRVFRLEFGQFEDEAAEVKLTYYGAVDRSHTDKTTFIMQLGNGTYFIY